MKSINLFFRVSAMAIYLFATIATCATVWNSKPGVTLSIIAGLLFAANGYVIYRWAKATEKEVKDNGGLQL